MFYRDAHLTPLPPGCQASLHFFTYVKNLGPPALIDSTNTTASENDSHLPLHVVDDGAGTNENENDSHYRLRLLVHMRMRMSCTGGASSFGFRAQRGVK